MDNLTHLYICYSIANIMEIASHILRLVTNYTSRLFANLSIILVQMLIFFTNYALFYGDQVIQRNRSVDASYPFCASTFWSSLNASFCLFFSLIYCCYCLGFDFCACAFCSSFCVFQTIDSFGCFIVLIIVILTFVLSAISSIVTDFSTEKACLTPK